MGKKKLGFIVNPIAGIGGRVGLKGSDIGTMVIYAVLRDSHQRLDKTIYLLYVIQAHKKQ